MAGADEEGAGEERDGVPLTNLDEPLFADAGRDQAGPRRLPRRGERRGSCPALRGPAAVGGPGPARAAGVHAEERAEVRPGLGPDGRRLGGAVPPRGLVRAVRRPADPAVVRQPAGGRVPPGAGAGRRAGRQTHLVLDLDPPAGAGFAAVVAAAHLVRQALADDGPDRRGEDLAARRACTCSCRSPTRPPNEEIAAATRALAVRAERLDPRLATTAYIVDRRGGQGVPRLHPVRRGDRGGRVQPAGAAGRAGLVPGRLGRPGPGRPRPTSPSAPRSPPSATATRGPSSCRRRRRCRPTWSSDGRTIPIARVAAMHEGKRRARERGTGP